MPAPTQVFLYFVTVQLRSTLMPIGVNVATLWGGGGTIILATGYYQQLCYCSSPNCAFDTKMAQMTQTPQIGTHDDKKCPQVATVATKNMPPQKVPRDSTKSPDDANRPKDSDATNGYRLLLALVNTETLEIEGKFQHRDFASKQCSRKFKQHLICREQTEI